MSKQMMDSEQNFGDPVLIPAHDKNSLELIDAYACKIDARSCSALVGKLATLAPLHAIKHAKRIRKRKDQPDKLDVLLLPIHQEDDQDADDDEDLNVNPSNRKTLFEQKTEAAATPTFHHAASTLPSGELPLSVLPAPLASALEGFTQGVFTVQIPRYPPHTKQDQVSWSRHWPVGIHLPTKVTLRDRIELSTEEITEMKRNMEIVIGLINKYVKNGGNLKLNACIIVDPNSGKTGRKGQVDGVGGEENYMEIIKTEFGSTNSSIVGSGVDETDVHPLRHAAMVAVETVAEWQKKTWFSNTNTATANTTANGTAVHGVDNEEEAETLRIDDRENGKNIEEKEALEEGDDLAEEVKRRRLHLNHHQVEDPTKSQTIQRPPEENLQQLLPLPVIDESTPYLCTGYDCYVLHEPCIMCAMALVHSRIRRVIFCKKDEQGGALGGCGLKLHSKRTLNHHYIVYHMPLLE